MKTNRDLFDLVVTYQILSHSNLCRKYDKPRYYFEKFVTEKTAVASYFPSTMSGHTKEKVLETEEKISAL